MHKIHKYTCIKYRKADLFSGEIFGRLIVVCSKYIPTLQIAYDEK
jgi:hypothetical protein